MTDCINKTMLPQRVYTINIISRQVRRESQI